MGKKITFEVSLPDRFEFWVRAEDTKEYYESSLKRKYTKIPETDKYYVTEEERYSGTTKTKEYIISDSEAAQVFLLFYMQEKDFSDYETVVDFGYKSTDTGEPTVIYGGCNDESK